VKLTLTIENGSHLIAETTELEPEDAADYLVLARRVSQLGAILHERAELSGFAHEIENPSGLDDETLDHLAEEIVGAMERTPAEQVHDAAAARMLNARAMDAWRDHEPEGAM